MRYFILIVFSTTLFACQNNSPADNNEKIKLTNTSHLNNAVATSGFDQQWKTNYVLDQSTLLSSVQAAIIPSYKDWVLFENGTYIIFDNIDTITDPLLTAKRWLKHYQQLDNSNNGSVQITDLDHAEGWSVFGNGYGIYTFVHLLEIKDVTPPEQIGLYAKWKRSKDAQNAKIIYLHNTQGLQMIK